MFKYFGWWLVPSTYWWVDDLGKDTSDWSISNNSSASSSRLYATLCHVMLCYILSFEFYPLFCSDVSSSNLYCTILFYLASAVLWLALFCTVWYIPVLQYCAEPCCTLLIFRESYIFNSFFCSLYLSHNDHLQQKNCNIICLIFNAMNLWMTVRAICLSILSMLSSCTKKERPPDDDVYNKVNPKKTRFVYHDDSV